MDDDTNDQEIKEPVINELELADMIIEDEDEDAEPEEIETEEPKEDVNPPKPRIAPVVYNSIVSDEEKQMISEMAKDDLYGAVDYLVNRRRALEEEKRTKLRGFLRETFKGASRDDVDDLEPYVAQLLTKVPDANKDNPDTWRAVLHEAIAAMAYDYKDDCGDVYEKFGNMLKKKPATPAPKPKRKEAATPVSPNVNVPRSSGKSQQKNDRYASLLGDLSETERKALMGGRR